MAKDIGYKNRCVSDLDFIEIAEEWQFSHSA